LKASIEAQVEVSLDKKNGKLFKRVLLEMRKLWESLEKRSKAGHWTGKRRKYQTQVLNQS